MTLCYRTEAKGNYSSHYARPALRRDSPKSFPFLKIKYRVVITVAVFLWGRGKTIRVRVEVLGVHHMFGPNQLIALDFRLGQNLFTLLIPHVFMGIEDGDGARLVLEVAQFLP